MNKSESIKNIGGALMKFHQEVGKIKKEGRNPFFNNAKYANLPTILESIKDPLQTAGLVVTQFPSGVNGMTTLIIHPESGEYLEDSYNINPKGTDPQSLGSAITYARRYSLGAVLALITDEDDDGNAASGKTNQQAQPVENKIPIMSSAQLETTISRISRAKSGETSENADEIYKKATSMFRFNTGDKVKLDAAMKS